MVETAKNARLMKKKVTYFTVYFITILKNNPAVAIPLIKN